VGPERSLEGHHRRAGGVEMSGCRLNGEGSSGHAEACNMNFHSCNMNETQSCAYMYLKTEKDIKT